MRYHLPLEWDELQTLLNLVCDAVDGREATLAERHVEQRVRAAYAEFQRMPGSRSAIAQADPMRSVRAAQSEFEDSYSEARDKSHQDEK